MAVLEQVAFNTNIYHEPFSHLVGLYSVQAYRKMFYFLKKKIVLTCRRFQTTWTKDRERAKYRNVLQDA